MKYFGYFAIFAVLLFAGCVSDAPLEAENASITVEGQEDTLQDAEETMKTPAVAGESPAEEPETEPLDMSGTITTGSYARCLEQCESIGGIYCKDGCRFEQAENTKELRYCDEMEQKESIPECYGTVAIAIGDIKICDKLSSEDRNHCIAAFLPR